MLIEQNSSLVILDFVSLKNAKIYLDGIIITDWFLEEKTRTGNKRIKDHS